MVDEKLDTRTEIAKSLSDISRNTGKVSFKVTYTSTPGNIEIDKRFQDFCFVYANNEYLAGISKLLDCFDSYKDRARMENYLAILEKRLHFLEEQLESKKDVHEESDEVLIKTF
jgi:hypothetical protein